MKIAGRCFCGFSMDWVARAPDEHLRCFRLRFCGRCGEAARINEHCVPCRRITSRNYMRRIRAAASPVYLRNKAAKRQRYRNPVYAAICRMKDKAQKARRRAMVAA